MNYTKEQIAEAFSTGAFEKTYEFIAENAEWIVVEENHFKGKQAILQNCEKVAAYFKSVTTDFKTFNIIANQNKVVINGTAEFKKNNQRVAFVSACDLYEYNHDNKIQKITSYCIPSKR
ncbi:hypothetical protein GV828_11620 [Flavobacterium sp. NST-5]|uniref:SnoaL-like domain-containing protein n=1 Tax=Flavobacterium ichthyis TaxID=2698827 RepID=A0ABW9ZFI0_9FLAO|nr:nuclear transport factor 2 family protein [Flavobacterium ichthyis]NBL65850.1 hypothetical protein [Flavobacterium ichthyis]